MDGLSLTDDSAEAVGTLSKAVAPSWLLNGENIAPATGVRVCIIGGGFVGLVTAAGMAQAGHTVTCVEKDTRKVSDLVKGRVGIYERHLPELVRANLERKRLRFHDDLTEWADDQDVFVVSVGTPSRPDGTADLTALHGVMESLAGLVRTGQVVVIKSTVPVGTAEWARTIVNSRNGHERPIPIVSNPEFLREGTAVYDYFHPQRIVVGGDDPDAVERVVQLYRVGLAHAAPIVTTDNKTAELIKYASNVYLATRVAFINELSGICDSFGIDIGDVSAAMGMDPRIGSDYLDAGPGFGGSCLPKDLNAYITEAKRAGLDLTLAPSVQRANSRQFERVVEKTRAMLDGALEGSLVGVLGLAFKAQTQDMRDSPAVHVIQRLIAGGARVQAYDPAAMVEAGSILPAVRCCPDAPSVASGADAILILTEWPEFQLLDWATMRGAMRRPNIIDARNLLAPESMKRLGFHYTGMGQR
ncbi:MAG: UDP-glucose/GDP-mannose dehydrogenase family protein [Candidatus Zixiibacteriota bacterium]